MNTTSARRRVPQYQGEIDIPFEIPIEWDLPDFAHTYQCVVDSKRKHVSRNVLNSKLYRQKARVFRAKVEHDFSERYVSSRDEVLRKAILALLREMTVHVGKQFRAVYGRLPCATDDIHLLMPDSLRLETNIQSLKAGTFDAFVADAMWYRRAA